MPRDLISSEVRDFTGDQRPKRTRSGTQNDAPTDTPNDTPTDAQNDAHMVNQTVDDDLPDELFEKMPQAALDQYLADALYIILIQEQKRRLTETEADLKQSLMATLEAYGEPYGPEGQHQTITFPAPIRGYTRLVRQCKVSITVDEARAEAISRGKGLFRRLFKPVLVLDEGAVMVAREEGLLTDEEVAEIFPKKVIWAFVPEKKKVWARP